MLGDIFVHRHGKDRELVQLWVKMPEEWVVAEVGKTSHPFLGGRVLAVRPKGNPSWVTAKTSSTYSGMKRRSKSGSLQLDSVKRRRDDGDVLPG